MIFFALSIHYKCLIKQLLSYNDFDTERRTNPFAENQTIIKVGFGYNERDQPYWSRFIFYGLSQNTLSNILEEIIIWDGPT